MEWWQSLGVEITALTGMILILVTIPCVLTIKKDSTSAVAWCLLVFFLPVVGTFLFVIFGYQHVHRPLKRKRKHKKIFGIMHDTGDVGEAPDMAEPSAGVPWQAMSRLAQRFGAFPLSAGNEITFYREGRPAFDAMFEAIRSASRHVHLEFFIFQPDEIGLAMIDLLAIKARAGVQVRFLYDAMGSRRLHRHVLQPLLDAGGRCSVFLPLNPLRRRIQVNMRDHRKLLIVDGRVAFTGGLNIGDEYLGKNPRYGFWRDTHLRLEGPAVAALQRVFVEGWDFAAEEDLRGATYFPPPARTGPHAVQIIQSGPDLELKSIREVYFAAISRARRRLWIATPYFIPDAGLRDALCLAGYQGIDVRIICQFHPDKWLPFFASRFYWTDVLATGGKIYQYTRGMLHSKVVLVDGEWASVGTANLDNRSLHLNFEVNCLIYSAPAVAELEDAFRDDMAESVLLDAEVFARRPLSGRLMENACRLMSPVL